MTSDEVALLSRCSNRRVSSRSALPAKEFGTGAEVPGRFEACHPTHSTSSAPVSENPVERKALLSGFPYAVIFEVSELEISIVAVAHLSREPFYWHTRSN
jgi:hypothetical protein